MLNYPVTLTPAEEGGFVITFADVPEAITQAKDKSEAILRARDALESALEIYIDDRKSLPIPSTASKGQLVTSIDSTALFMSNQQRALEIFRGEVTAVSESYFIWKNINNLIARNEAIKRGVNENPRIWNAMLFSFQNSFLIVLGRLFDNDERSLSIHTLLQSGKENVIQYSLEALRRRRIRENGGIEPPWLDEFIGNSRQPTVQFFDDLIAMTAEIMKIYEEAYQPIRHKFIAHRDISAIDQSREFFQKTNIDELEKLLAFIYQVEMVVWEALTNGNLMEIGYFPYTMEKGVIRDLETFLAKFAIPEKTRQ